MPETFPILVPVQIMVTACLALFFVAGSRWCVRSISVRVVRGHPCPWTPSPSEDVTPGRYCQTNSSHGGATPVKCDQLPGSAPG